MLFISSAPTAFIFHLDKNVSYSSFYFEVERSTAQKYSVNVAIQSV